MANTWGTNKARLNGNRHIHGTAFAVSFPCLTTSSIDWSHNFNPKPNYNTPKQQEQQTKHVKHNKSTFNLNKSPW
jgi:hypothetical protein